MTSTTTSAAPAMRRSDSTGRRSTTHDPLAVGPIVPRAELRRVLTGLQRGLDRMEFRSELSAEYRPPQRVLCAGGAPPAAGSVGAKLYNSLGRHRMGAALGGLSYNGGGKVPVDSGLRDYFNIEQQVLDPEKAVNWAIGFDYTPSGNSSPA